MRVLTACELFRQGKPYPTVDIAQQSATEAMTDELIEELEGDGDQRPCQGHLWLGIKSLFDVQPMPPAVTVESDSKADNTRRTSKRRSRMSEVAARLRAEEKNTQKQLAAAAAAEKKKAELEKASRRRYVNKVVDRKLAKVHAHTHTHTHTQTLFSDI